MGRRRRRLAPTTSQGRVGGDDAGYLRQHMRMRPLTVAT